MKLLQELIRIDTSDKNSGNETKLCRYVKRLLAADGIRCEIYESTPGRGNLVARLKGDGSKEPLLLMAHIDVVQVDRSKWDEDPFAGVIRGPYLWGRGALDDKGMAAILTHVFRLLKRRGVKLSRDVILMLNADEESGGVFGAEWMVNNHLDKIKAEMVFNEGGRIPLRDGEVSQFAVQTAEKIYNDVRIWIRGKSGHSSVPLPDNAIYTLAELLSKLRSYRTPVRVTDTVSQYLMGSLPQWETEKTRKLAIGAAQGHKGMAKTLAAANPRMNAILRTTVVPTVIKGGIRVNVLPPDVEVNLNIRLLPGDNLDTIIKEVAKHIGLKDYVVLEKGEEIPKTANAAFIVDFRSAEAPGSTLDSPLLEAIKVVAQEMAPGASVVPFMSTGATDSRFFRAKGMTAYGLLPMPVTLVEEKTFHDHNERVLVKSIRFGTEFVYRVIREVGR